MLESGREPVRWRGPAGAMAALALMLSAAGCGGPSEGNLPPPKAATPEEMKDAAASVEAGRPKMPNEKGGKYARPPGL